MEQNYMEVLREEMRGQFSLVLEGHAALHTKIDDVRRELVERLDLTDFKVQVISDEIKVLKEDVADLKENLAAHRADTVANPRYIVRE
ncbi:MAG: hypothetical protein FIB02_03585 [Desulfuromonas sp.]|nr:hypothetical protein [Desulfuromonas sp.]